MIVGDEADDDDGRDIERDGARPPARPPLRAARNWDVESIAFISEYDASAMEGIIITFERIVDVAINDPATLRIATSGFGSDGIVNAETAPKEHNVARVKTFMVIIAVSFPVLEKYLHRE
jgi:hypothetical protein